MQVRGIIPPTSNAANRPRKQTVVLGFYGGKGGSGGKSLGERSRRNRNGRGGILLGSGAAETGMAAAAMPGARTVSVGTRTLTLAIPAGAIYCLAQDCDLRKAGWPISPLNYLTDCTVCEVIQVSIFPCLQRNLADHTSWRSDSVRRNAQCDVRDAQGLRGLTMDVVM